MKRTEWTFPYLATTLSAAANIKHIHHIERYAFCTDKKTEVMANIRAEGLEFDESMATEFSKLGNYTRQTTVNIRNDLLKDLTECTAKIKEHSDKAQGYDAWIQILTAAGEKPLELEQDDWLYFFGK